MSFTSRQPQHPVVVDLSEDEDEATDPDNNAHRTHPPSQNLEPQWFAEREEEDPKPKQSKKRHIESRPRLAKITLKLNRAKGTQKLKARSRSQQQNPKLLKLTKFINPFDKYRRLAEMINDLPQKSPGSSPEIIDLTEEDGDGLFVSYDDLDHGRLETAVNLGHENMVDDAGNATFQYPNEGMEADFDAVALGNPNALNVPMTEEGKGNISEDNHHGFTEYQTATQTQSETPTTPSTVISSSNFASLSPSYNSNTFGKITDQGPHPSAAPPYQDILPVLEHLSSTHLDVTNQLKTQLDAQNEEMRRLSANYTMLQSQMNHMRRRYKQMDRCCEKKVPGEQESF